MGLLDSLKRKRQDKHIESLSLEEINKEIQEKKEEIEALKKDIAVLKLNETKKVKAISDKKQQLRKDQKELLQSFNAEKKQLNTELSKVNELSEKNKTLYDKLDKEVNKKIAVLAAKRDELISKATDKNDAMFKKQRQELFDLIEALETEQTNQKIAYKNKLDQIEKEYEKLYVQKEEKLNVLLDKLSQVKKERDTKVQEANKKLFKEETKALARRKAVEEESQVAKKVAEKEFADLDEKKAVLSDLYAQLDSIKAEHKAVLDDYNVSKEIRDQEINNYSKELENERKEVQALNDKLKRDIDNLQREIDDEKNDHINRHDAKINELDNLEKSLAEGKKEALDDFNRMIDGTRRSNKEYITNFSNFLEEKYRKQVELNEKALNTLKDELEAHQKQIKENGASLDKALIANKGEFERNLSGIKMR